MHFQRQIYFIIALLTIHLVQSTTNITAWRKIRQKRFLMYADSGSTKLGISMSIPVELHDNKKWRSFNLIFNFNFQYDMPHKAEDWWNYYNWQTSTSDSGRALLGPKTVDLTAMYAYAVFENYMTNMGVNGRQCMQRAICENAQVLHEAEDIIERIYQRLMTPEDSSEEFYKDAYVEGTKGVDCMKTYRKCPIGDSLFDKFVQYQN